MGSKKGSKMGSKMGFFDPLKTGFLGKNDGLVSRGQTDLEGPDSATFFPDFGRT